MENLYHSFLHESSTWLQRIVTQPLQNQHLLQVICHVPDLYSVVIRSRHQQSLVCRDRKADHIFFMRLPFRLPFAGLHIEHSNLPSTAASKHNSFVFNNLYTTRPTASKLLTTKVFRLFYTRTDSLQAWLHGMTLRVLHDLLCK